MSNNVRIGKFDILTVYTYAKAKASGANEDAAKVQGYVVAVMGAQGRGGRRGGGSSNDFTAIKQAAEGKKRTTITPDTYDNHVAKLGTFYEDHFLPELTRLIGLGLSYDQVKVLVAIPPVRGAKISGEQFITNCTRA